MAADAGLAGNTAQVGSPLDGQTAAAILLMLLSDEDAGEIVGILDPVDVRRLGESMFKVAMADEATVEAALDLFVERARSVSSLAIGVEPHIRSVLTRAVGNVRADNILTGIAPRGSAAALDLLRWMDIATISGILRQEHSQVAALVLAVLTPETAATALASFEEERQADLLARAARLTKISREAIEDLETILAGHASACVAAPPMKLGGSSDAARIVNRMRKADGKRLIESIRQKDEDLATAIERELFVFDDLAALDSRNLGAVLRAVEAATLTLALKGAPDTLVGQMLGCLSTRAAQTIRDEMAESPPARRAEVDETQRAVIAAARKLADEGSIQLGGEDDYV